ncbi:hypothetical protein E2C01_008604 [Portunus trituberculatus]|uniref:Uncharacterized protein n=1 Tax=Portunus trituberculatus TaxID=210409 RepID=A0A5B7D3K3_PORTR|nr:hypothetical protein [Portunus trituberculatus]
MDRHAVKGNQGVLPGRREAVRARPGCVLGCSGGTAYSRGRGVEGEECKEGHEVWRRRRRVRRSVHT